MRTLGTSARIQAVGEKRTGEDREMWDNREREGQIGKVGLNSLLIITGIWTQGNILENEPRKTPTH